MRSPLFPPDASSVPQARHFLTSLDLPEVMRDTLCLLATELATNAVLHARTPFYLDVEVSEDCVCLCVADSSSTLPTLKDYDTSSATGRGLRLVASLSLSWGVDATPQGKSVWVRLDPTSPPAEDAVLRDLFALDLDTLDCLDWDVPSAAHHMVLESLPLDLYRDWLAHRDELLREFALLSPSLSPEALPVRLLRAVTPPSALSRVYHTNTPHTLVDLPVSLTDAEVEDTLALGRLMDAAEAYCREGSLLTLLPPPAVRDLRRWICSEVARQARSLPPRPFTLRRSPLLAR